MERAKSRHYASCRERERLRWTRRQRVGLKCRQMKKEGVKEEEVERKEE